MSAALVTDRQARSNPDVRIHLPSDVSLNEHLSATDGTVAVTLTDDNTTVKLEHVGFDGKSTLIFRVTGATNTPTEHDLEEIAGALSDSMQPFVAVEPDS